MPLFYSGNKGKSKSIEKYQKQIENSLLPLLKENYDIDINNRPIRATKTTLTYKGLTYNEDSVMLELLSNYEELDEPNTLFVTVYYNSRGVDAGIINMNNVYEASEIIGATLYDMGYRTKQEVESEKLYKETKEKAEKEKQQAEEKEALAKRKEELMRDVEMERQAKENEPEDTSDVEESSDSIEEFNTLFDKYLPTLKIGDYFDITIAIDYENQVKFLGIKVTYVTATVCYVVTNGITPALDKQVDLEKVKPYINKIAEKFNGVITLEAYDESGAELPLPETDDDRVKLDFDI